MVENQTPCETNHKWEGYHNHGEGRGEAQTPNQGCPAPGTLTGKPYTWLKN